MRRFIIGDALQHLPNLAMERAALMLVPITEESIEGKHAIVARGLRRAARVSPAYISMNVLRATELERQLDKQPTLIKVMAAAVPSRTPFQNASLLGLLSHPTIQKQLETRMASGKKMCKQLTHSRLGDVMYRCDADTQFAGHEDADRRMARRRRQFEKSRKQQQMTMLADLSPIERVTLIEAGRHFASHCNSMDFVTVPDGGSRLDSVDLRQQLQAQTVRSNATMWHNPWMVSTWSSKMKLGDSLVATIQLRPRSCHLKLLGKRDLWR